MTKLFLNGDQYFSKVKVGSVVFGDLKNLGFVVVRAPKPNKGLKHYVLHTKKQYCLRSPSIGNKNRILLFPTTVTEHAKGVYENGSHLRKHLNQIMSKVVHPMLNEEYTHQKVNFIYNKGDIEFSQRPHCDYKNSKDEGEEEE